MPASIIIGILALQGAFAEHQITINSLATKSCTKIKEFQSISSKLVKSPEDLDFCDALIIPGGESTTMAKVAAASGLLEPLREFVKKKPVWGTCAGAILLAESIEGSKRGGQELLGGISVKVERNGFGSQIASFEAPLVIVPKNTVLTEKEDEFVGVFIRAPVILSIDNSPSKPEVEIIARISPEAILPRKDGTPATEDDPRTVVALRQGHLMLTTYHPELTKDNRFHEYFLLEVVTPFIAGRDKEE